MKAMSLRSGVEQGLGLMAIRKFEYCSFFRCPTEPKANSFSWILAPDS